MDRFNDKLDKVIDAIFFLTYHIERDENIKEYLIEQGLWEEDYEPEFNVLTILEDYYRHYYN